jgi:hypothetical protein
MVDNKDEKVEVIITKTFQKTINIEKTFEQSVQVPKKMLDNNEFEPEDWFEDEEFEMECECCEYEIQEEYEDYNYMPIDYQYPEKKQEFVFSNDKRVSLLYGDLHYNEKNKKLLELGFKITYEGNYGQTWER